MKQVNPARELNFRKLGIERYRLVQRGARKSQALLCRIAAIPVELRVRCSERRPRNHELRIGCDSFLQQTNCFAKLWGLVRAVENLACVQIGAVCRSTVGRLCAKRSSFGGGQCELECRCNLRCNL